MSGHQNNPDDGKGLIETIELIRKRVPDRVAEWGSCEVTVGPGNVLAKYGIGKVDGTLIHVEAGIKFMSTGDDDQPDIALDGPLVHFHKDDHEMFGSKATGSDDDPDEVEW